MVSELTVVYYWLLIPEVDQSRKGRHAILFCQFLVVGLDKWNFKLVTVIVNVLQFLQCQLTFAAGSICKVENYTFSLS